MTGGPYVITESRLPVWQHPRVKEIIYDRKKQAEDFKSKYNDTWLEYDQLYKSYRNPKKHIYRANIFVPFVFALGETTNPRIRLSIFTPEPFFFMRAEDSNQQESVDNVERFIYNQMTKMGLGRKKTKTRDVIQSTWKYGTCFTKMKWLSGYEQRPDFDIFEVFDAYPNPHATDPRNLGWFISHALIDWQSLMKMQDNGLVQGVEKLKNDKSSGNDDYRYKRMAQTEEAGVFSYGDTENPMIDVWEYLDNDSLVWRAGSSEEIIRTVESPFGFIPVTVHRYLPEPNEIYGIALMRHLKDMQLELNDQRNLKMDAASLVMNPSFRVDPGADIDFDLLVARPNGVYPFRKDELEPMTWPDIKQVWGFDESLLKEDMQLGAGETFRELVPHARDTATASLTAQKTVAMRQEDPTCSLQESFLHMVEMALKFNQMFMLEPANTGMMWNGLDGTMMNQYTVNKEMLNIPLTINAADAPTTNPIKEIGRQKDAQAMQILMAAGQIYPIYGMPSALPNGMPDLNKPFVDIGQLLKGSFDRIDIPNKDNILFTGERAAQKWTELIQKGIVTMQDTGFTPGTLPPTQGLQMPPLWVTQMQMGQEGGDLQGMRNQPYTQEKGHNQSD